MILREWHQYWAWVGGNVGAMPLQALISVVVTVVFRKPAGRFLRWLSGESAALREAKAARRIAADLHLRMTGEAHPDAPAPDSGNEVA